MSGVELKPCPFCQDAMWLHPVSGLIRHSDQSDENPCPIRDHAFTNLERWNTRATTARLDALREAREAVEAFAVALENSDFANVAHELNSQMCCDGHMCGCRGSTVGEYLAHELRATLTLTAAIARAEGA